MQNDYWDIDGKIKHFPEDRIIQNENINNILRFMYKRVIEKIPEIYVLDFSQKGFIASHEHIWGLAPMHYESAYYEELLQEIIKIISSK